MGRGPGSLSNPMQNAQHMQQQQLASAGGMSLPQQLQQNQNAGAGGFGASGMNSPLSPSQQQSMAQTQQNAMFGMGGSGLQGLGNMMGGTSSSGGGGMSGGGAGNMGMGGVGNMDPRMMGGNLPGGMSMGGNGTAGNLTSHQQQRQLLLMQQQRAGGNVGMPMGGGGSASGGLGVGGGAGGGGGGMTPAQFANMNMSGMGSGNVSAMMQQQIMQERMRQQQQAAQMGGASSPTHGGSPMGSETGFPGSSAGPSMRSTSSIPGIARSTRSPSDTGPSPLTPRGPMQRGPSGSMTQEDYQRMLQQQQHGQAVRAMSSQSPAFNQQMMGSQQQAQMLAHQQLQHQQQQQQGGSSYGMSPPPSATGAQFGGGVSAPSPTNSQSWGTPAVGSGYPFAPSPATSDHPRHMSATPAPQQQRQGTPQNTPPAADQNIPNDFDLFTNWTA